MNETAVTPQFLLITIASIFTIINPLGATSLFLSHSTNLPKSDVHRMARRASIACFLVLTLFAFTGQAIFHWMGITIPAFRIAGGILVFRIALDMLKGQNVRSRTLPEEQKEAQEKEDIAIMPLAVPLLAGPGAITTVIVLMTRAHTWRQTSVIVFSIFFVCFLTYIILSQSSLLLKVLGASGVRVMNRLLGLILAAISIQFVINGIKDLIPEFAKIWGNRV
jgi:multiple antibiotic resistance protein